MTEDKLFSLFNEAHLGNFKIINRALQDKNVVNVRLVSFPSVSSI